MWQAPAAAWSPPPQEEREAAGAARRAELRDFIAIRRALLHGGSKAPSGPPPKQQRAWGRQRGADRSSPAPACFDWQAIQQQAHQGFEAMLREAGLPVNAGFSRPASFTAAAAGMQHPAAQLAPYYGGGYGMAAAPQVPWVAPPGSWVPAPLPPVAQPQHEPPAWHEQQHWQAQPIQQQQPHPFAATQLQLPPPQDAAPLIASPGRPPSVLLTQQQLLLVQAAAARCRASTSLPVSPGRPSSPLRPHSVRPTSAAPQASLGTVMSLRRSGSEGAVAAAAAAFTGSTMLPLQAQLASMSASCSLGQAAEEQLERQQQQRLLKLDSDLVASASWRAERQPTATAPAPADLPATGCGGAAPHGSRPASTAEEAAVPASSLQRSMTGGSSGSSLASSALQVLVATAEADDVPRMESEAIEAQAQPGIHMSSSSQLEAAVAVSASDSFASQGAGRHSSTAELPAAIPAAQPHQPLSSSAAPPPAPTAPAPADDPLAAAAAALARFEQLQSQLQQLQAGLPPPPVDAGVAPFPAREPLLQPVAARPPEAAASPVAKVMRQAESFLEQAQQLLQRLNLAAASPQQPPLPPQHQQVAAAVCTAEQAAVLSTEQRAAAPVAVQPAEQQQQPPLVPQQPESGGGVYVPGQNALGGASLVAASAASQPGPVLPQPVLAAPAWQFPAAEQPATAEVGHTEGSCGVSDQVSWQEAQMHAQHEQVWPAMQQPTLQQPAWAGGQQVQQLAAVEEQQHQHLAWEQAQQPQQAAPLAWQVQALYEQPSQAWLQPEACYSYADLVPERSAAYAQAGWQGSEAHEQQQPLDWGRRQRWEGPTLGQRGRQAARPAGGYAQRRQAAASAAGSRPGSGPAQQQRSPERPGQVEQGSYLQAARVAKERAARQAAERERLRQQNEAARQAARLKAAQEKQRQEQEERERQAAAQQAAQRRQLAGSMRSSVYLQRLRVQRAGKQLQQQQAAGELPDWAKAARPLPPLLPSKPAGQAPVQGSQEAAVRQDEKPSVGDCPPACMAAHAAPHLSGGAEQQGDAQRAQAQQVSPRQQDHQHQQHERTLTEEEQQLQAALASLDARLPYKGPTQAAEALLVLSSRSNSVLQEQLRCSLARLDEQPADAAAGQVQQTSAAGVVGSAAGHTHRKPAASAGGLSSEPVSVVLAGAEGMSGAPGGVEPQPALAAQQAHAAALQEAKEAWYQPGASPAAKAAAAQQAPLPPLHVAEQQPLQWRLRPRSLAGALNAASTPAATPAGTAAAAADAVCHINIGNVGKPCHMPAAMLQPASPAGLAAAASGVQQPAASALGSSSGKQAVLPPLRKESLWPAGQQGKGSGAAPSAPVLRTAARAAARPSRMQPLQAGTSPASCQQPAQQQWQAQWPGWEQQQQGVWPGWGQQPQQQQAQWWQHFPPGWQQYQQPLQQWGGAAAGLAAGYGGAWHWAQ